MSTLWAHSGKQAEEDVRQPKSGGSLGRLSPLFTDIIEVLPGEGLRDNTAYVYLVTSSLPARGTYQKAKWGQHDAPIENQEAVNRRQRSQDFGIA